jgi:hypothetical protein
MRLLVSAAAATLLFATACSTSASVEHAAKPAAHGPTVSTTPPVSEADSVCDPKYQIPLPMPPAQTLKEPLTYAAMNVALQPPPPGTHPKVSAAAAWRTVAQFGLPDDQTGLVLALFTSEFPELQTSRGFKSLFVRRLAWVVTAEGLISSEEISVPPGSVPSALPACLPYSGLSAVDATTGQQLMSVGAGAGPDDVCLGIADAYLTPPECPKKN